MIRIWLPGSSNRSTPTGAEEVIDPDGNRVSFYEALLKNYSIGKPTDLLFELLINRRCRRPIRRAS